MSVITTFALLVAGLFLLIKGADWLVSGASSLAKRIGVSDLVIGLTVVSFGTSMPELLVNVLASLNGSAELAIGNVLGSNISNTLLILGITAIAAPLAIQRSTVIKEIPFSLLASLVLLIMANDMLIDGYQISELGKGDGLTFLGFFTIFLYYTFGMRREDALKDKHTEATTPVVFAVGKVVAGLVCLSSGGHLSVESAIEIALLLGVSEALVGLTAVAIGTSLPELVASVVAARKGKADIAVGNIVGSNIFNILWILGLSAVIKPLPFKPALNVDLIVVVLSAMVLFFIIHNGQLHKRLLMWWKQDDGYVIRRWEGVALLASYIGYIGYIGWRG